MVVPTPIIYKNAYMFIFINKLTELTKFSDIPGNIYIPEFWVRATTIPNFRMIGCIVTEKQ